MDDIRAKVKQVFRYLLEVRKAWDKPLFHIDDHEKYWWQTDLQSWLGVEWGEREEDAWLRVYRTTQLELPIIPQSLATVVKDEENPNRKPKLANEAQEEKGAEFAQWLEEVWYPWSKKAKEAKISKQLYDELFALYNRLQDDSDTLELVFGHGLLTWKTDRGEISRHLFVTPMELKFDVEEGLFSLYPTSKGTRFDGDWLTHVTDIETQPLYDWIDRLQSNSFSPRNEYVLKKQLVHLSEEINLQAKVVTTDEPIAGNDEEPILSYSPALIVQKIGNFLWQRELTRAIEAIDHGHPIPYPLQQLVSEKLTSIAETDAGGEKPLFYPLTANQHQKEVAEKLHKYDGVVVQGPPGTGKSHSIANLIGHLLAQGKRVLVTSEKERALDVLRGKLPPEIASLSVSLLGSDSYSMNQLDDAIRQIAANLESKEPKIQATKIEKWQKRLTITQEKISTIKKQIIARVQLEQQPIGETDLSLTPQQAAQWLNTHGNSQWITDEIPFQTKDPLTPEEQKQLIVGLNRFPASEWSDYEQSRPKTADLLTPASFERMFHELEQTSQAKKGKEGLIQHWNLSAPLSSSLEAALKTSHEAVNKLKLLVRKKWQINILKDVVAGGDRYVNWDEFIADGRERLIMINNLQKDLLEYEIKLPIDRKEGLIREDLLYILDRIGENKGTGWMFQHVYGRKFSYIYKECLINDTPLRHDDDLRLLVAYIDWKDLLSRFVLRWNRMMDLVDGPFIESDNRRIFVEITEYLDELEQLFQWNDQLVRPLHKWVEDLGVPQVDWTSLDWFQQFTQGLDALNSYMKWKQVDQYHQQIVASISRGKEKSNSHPIWIKLEQACLQKNVEHWRESYQELQSKEQVQAEFEEFQALLQRLSDVCPKWAKQFVEQQQQKEQASWPVDWADAWRGAQLRSWLEEYQTLPHIDQLENELLKTEENEVHALCQLVVEMAWKEMIESTSAEQKRSLIAWSQNIKKIGKGSGKYANKYRHEASREMKRCIDMIPVWIMPLHRVIETMDISKDRFDVVIVDESSQSNLFALSALLRADKVVIVGDDKQISPEGIGFDRQLNHELMDRYLKDIPQMAHMEIMTSLYDLANRVFPSKVVLKEHFRSVPEIIHFSNQHFYDNQIDLLRIPLPEDIFNPPVVAIHVPEGIKSEGSKYINIPEAEAIIEKIVACCEDERYAGKTMGVISLQRNDQARWIENRLRETIGETEMLRRKLVCGDPYRFQGDERDVVFLSMVVASNQSLGVLSKETDRRRINVAASRARDQLFLFHSVELDELHPQCLRAKLLQYMQHPHIEKIEDSGQESYFDHHMVQSIYSWLDQQGYDVTTNEEYGEIIVTGKNSRLSIHCIHDIRLSYDQWEEKWSRKKVIKQMGWDVHHILAGLYYYDSAAVMFNLEERIRRLNINPSERKLMRPDVQEFVATTTNYF